MKLVAQMTLSEMLTGAAAFRGESENSDPVVTNIRLAAHRLAWGIPEEEVWKSLVDSGTSPEDAFLAVRAGGLL